MAKQNRFVYQGRTAEDTIRRTQQAGRSYDNYLIADIPTFKAREGENVVRILPGTWEDTETWENNWDIKVFVHYGIGADNSTYLCLKKMRGEDCPVCNARAGADEEEAQQLRVSERHLAWMIDRDNEKAGPQVWSVAPTLFKDINGRAVGRNKELIRLEAVALEDGDEEGFDIAFTREGTGLKTDYSGVEVMRDPSPLHDDMKIMKRWLTYIADHPLPDVLNYYEADYIEKVMFGKRQEAGARPRTRASEDKEERRAPPASRARQTRVAEEELVEEEDLETVEQEEEQTPPSRARRGNGGDASDTGRRRAAPPKANEEEEVEVEETVGGDEPPRRSGRLGLRERRTQR